MTTTHNDRNMKAMTAMKLIAACAQAVMATGLFGNEGKNEANFRSAA